LFLFDSNAFKTGLIAVIFPRLGAVYCELNCEQRFFASQFNEII